MLLITTILGVSCCLEFKIMYHCIRFPGAPGNDEYLVIRSFVGNSLEILWDIIRELNN